MVRKRKSAATISLSILSLLVLSVIPVCFDGALATQASYVAAGDVLKYKVTRFDVDLTRLNEEPDNPIRFRDSTFLEGSVLYIKIMLVETDELTYTTGFILGNDTTVDIDKSFFWSRDMDTTMLPDSIMLPCGAGLILPLTVTYDPTDPFREDMTSMMLPLVIDPMINWENLRYDLAYYDPTDVEIVNGKLTASWEHELASYEEGFENATIVWDKNEGGILKEAAIEGQQEYRGQTTPFNIQITFLERDLNKGLPAVAWIGYTEQYILSEVDVYVSGIEEQQELTDTISRINGLAGTTALELRITDIDGLVYEYDLRMFPDEPDLTRYEEGKSIGFGLGIPFLTPDWDFYTSILGSGNFLMDIITTLVVAISPVEDVEIPRFILELLVSVEQDFHYFGLTMGETVSARDPESGIFIFTETDINGWLAYEEDGLFGGLYFSVDGRVRAEGQGQDVDMSFGLRAKIDRANLVVPTPQNLEKPDLTKFCEKEEAGDGISIPISTNTILIGAAVALLVVVLFIIVVRRR